MHFIPRLFARPHAPGRAWTVPLMLALSACGESKPSTTGPGGNGNGNANPVTSIAVSPALDTLTALGQSVQFTASPKDASGVVTAVSQLSWASADTSVAKVDSTGLVMAAANGTSAISATAQGITGSATIVVAQTATAVEVSASRDTLRGIGDTTRVIAAARDANGHSVNAALFTWSSSDSSVVTVDSTGLAHAVGEGGATIKAMADALSDSAGMAVVFTLTFAIRTEPAGASAGMGLTTQPVIELRDYQDQLMASDSATVVTAALASGGGTLVGDTAVTVVGGVATFTTLGVGGTVGPRTVEFRATDVPTIVSQSFDLTAGPADTMFPTGGDAQVAPAATALPANLAVSVTDAYANPVAGAPVAWVRTVGEGSSGSASTVTDQDGDASVSYNLGVHAGTDTVEATMSGVRGSPVVFTVTATPNATISGVVTLSNTFLSPPIAAAPAGIVPVAPQATKSISRPRLASAPSSASVPAVRPVLTNDLIVTYRSEAVRAPLAGNVAALRSATTMRAVSARIQFALANGERAGRYRVRGVSPAVRSARVTVDDLTRLDAVAAELRRDPRVESVERDAMAYSHGEVTRATMPPIGTSPNDPLYAWQAWHYQMMDLHKAWDITTGSNSVVVAVVDDGIRFDHPDIAANLTSDGYDFVSNSLIPVCSGGSQGSAGDGDGYDPDPTNPLAVNIDPNSGCITSTRSSGNHGLHVAGTIGAASNNGSGVAGVNWNVSIRPVRVLGIAGFGSYYDIAQGILYAAGLPADNGIGGTVQPSEAADIINLSLGGSSPSTTLQQAMQAASAADVVIVASAGNARSSAPNYPAAYAEAISVTALGPDGLLASYSSFGSTVDIASPGGDRRDGGCSFGVISTTWDFVNPAPIYDCWQGTSMAAPHVAGVAALLKAADPSLTAAQIRSRLETYSVDLGPAGWDDQYGHGLVNAYNALTQSAGPPANLFVSLYDASSGALVQTTAASGGAYEFTELADGSYLVFAGEDESMDRTTGTPVRRWGASGGSASPSSVTLDGAATYPASFPIGIPIEDEPNASLNQANHLAIGGYLFGSISPASDSDLSRIEIPTNGTYVFETVAPGGACGFALEEDTILGLYDSGGSLITSNDDIDLPGLDYCSRITIVLSPGTYYLGVTGYNGGRYTLRATGP